MKDLYMVKENNLTISPLWIGIISSIIGGLIVYFMLKSKQTQTPTVGLNLQENNQSQQS